MTATHTPGPWKVVTNNIVTTDDMASIGCVSQGFAGFKNGEPEANARLIAAAPDLLAALEAVDEFWAGGDAPPELTAQMRAAIAKARGA